MIEQKSTKMLFKSFPPLPKAGAHTYIYTLTYNVSTRKVGGGKNQCEEKFVTENEKNNPKN